MDLSLATTPKAAAQSRASLSDLVVQCLKKFQVDGNGNHSQLQDELGRFRVWVGNVAAHRPQSSRRSLEYRLRDSSNLQKTVVILLNDLHDALDRALQVGPDAAPRPLENLVSDQSSDEGFELSDEEDQEPTQPSEQALGDVHEVINCLLRFSMALRRPARHDRIKQGAVSTSRHYEPNDIEHVRTKLPGAPAFLVERLGKAISQNRQYFKYREDHHRKLQEGLQQGGAEVNEESTIATSLPFQTEKQQMGLISDAETDYTATSYAHSVDERELLQPPAWPKEGHDGDPFECPICFAIIVADTEKSWKQHVFEDIPPYICTSPDCLTAVKVFARRRDWMHHEATMHHSLWDCPFDCSTVCSTSQAFEEHLRGQHALNIDSTSMQSMSGAYARRRVDTAEVQCHLCKSTHPTRKLLSKHVGHHLEQLALFALPSHILYYEEEEAAKVYIEDNRTSRPVTADSVPTVRKIWFLPANGIDRHVITADIQRYLGNDATARPGIGLGEYEGVAGYWIRSVRVLTPAMISDLRHTSARWNQEQRKSNTRKSYVEFRPNDQALSGNTPAISEMMPEEPLRRTKGESSSGSDSDDYNYNDSSPAAGSRNSYAPAHRSSYGEVAGYPSVLDSSARRTTDSDRPVPGYERRGNLWAPAGPTSAIDAQYGAPPDTANLGRAEYTKQPMLQGGNSASKNYGRQGDSYVPARPYPSSPHPSPFKAAPTAIEPGPRDDTAPSLLRNSSYYTGQWPSQNDEERTKRPSIQTNSSYYKGGQSTSQNDEETPDYVRRTKRTVGPSISGSATGRYIVEDSHGRRSIYASREEAERVARLPAGITLEESEALQKRMSEAPGITLDEIKRSQQTRDTNSHRKIGTSSRASEPWSGIHIRTGDTVLQIQGGAKVEVRQGEDGEQILVIGGTSGRESSDDDISNVAAQRGRSRPGSRM